MGVIRFLLALSVVFYHLYFTLGEGAVPNVHFAVGGTQAVQLFFIISGFYMALVLNEKYPPGRKSYWLFITNRYLRLYPTYIVTTILTVAYCIIVVKINTHRSTDYLSLPGSYLPCLYSWAIMQPRPHLWQLMTMGFSNLFIFGQDWTFFFHYNKATTHMWWVWDYLSPSGDNIPVRTFMLTPQAWTLGTELTFYLLAPLFARKKASWIVGIMVCSLALRVWLAQALGDGNINLSYRFFPTELALFAAGCLAYKLYAALRGNTLKSLENLTWAPLLIIGLVLFYPYADKRFYFFAVFALALPFIFQLTKNNQWDRYIGELSYPLYMIHWLVLSLCNTIFSTRHLYMHGTLLMITAVSSCVLAAVVMVIAIELPVERWRVARTKKSAQLVKSGTEERQMAPAGP